MPRIDAEFLYEVQEHCNGGLEWCDRREIERLDLVAISTALATIAAKEDTGMASYGISMFKLGYETRKEWNRRTDEAVEQGQR